MRYYSLIISDPKTGLVFKPAPNGLGFIKSAGGFTFSSFVNGQTDPGALNIEFDAPVYAYNQSQGRQWIRVWGVGLPMIGQASDLNGANFLLSAGMKPGLPLATAAANQAGVIMQGKVFQSFGNWEGVVQTLEFVVNPAADGVRNLGFNWPAGTSLSQAITVTLMQAFSPPNSPIQYKPNVNIGSNLVLAGTQAGTYQNLEQFASTVHDLSLQAGVPVYGDSYAGVQITITGNTINVFDGQGAMPAKVIQLAFRDLIGQVTWINPTQVNFNTVLRSDIACGMNVQFPFGRGGPFVSPFVLTSAAAVTGGSNAPASDKTSFQGQFYINTVHHWANFRQPDGESWKTGYTATPVPPKSVIAN